jgi:hypothetical protein
VSEADLATNPAGIWTAGLPETFSKEKIAAVNDRFEDAPAFRGLIENLDRMRMTRRPHTLVHARRGRGHRRVPDIRAGGRHHRHVRQRHQRYVPQLEDRTRGRHS